ncbi:MAG TPA: hypothetical protein DCG54_02185, partial [Anaerolineae bacterium]|nr:hypothetical protein [Anaerolineae bacterium]
KMFLFFAVTNEKSFPIPTDQSFPIPATPTSPGAQLLPLEPVRVSQPTSTATPDATCSTPASKTGHFCQVRAAEAQAGFDAREFLYDPKGLKFSSAEFIPETGEIRMEFVVITGGGYLHLRQGVAGFPMQTDNWGKVPSDAVEQVEVNGLYAEIASGTYVVYPGATSAVWEPGGQLSLAWRDGGHWFVLEKLGDPYPIEWITNDELITLAEGLVDERPVDAVPPLDPEYLSTVEQAEALAGFHIPSPVLVPRGYELKRVVWMDNVARLMYGPKNSSNSELFISLGQIANNQVGPCDECPPGVTETVQVGPWTGWYWRGTFYTGLYVEGQPTATPVWQGNAPLWSLAWNTEQFWFSMSYNPSFNSGKEMSKEILIKIAESMFPDANTLKIDLAERQAGFNLMLPPRLPGTVSGYVKAEYNPANGVVWIWFTNNPEYMNGLYLSQQVVSNSDNCFLCGAVASDDTSGLLTQGPEVVGTNAKLKNVKVGAVTGQYYVGIRKGSGEWDPNSDIKHLRWQVGDRAFELVSLGTGLNLEFLIMIAESLE